MQCCSYSVVSIHGAYIVSFSVESIVLLHYYYYHHHHHHPEIYYNLKSQGSDLNLGPSG